MNLDQLINATPIFVVTSCVLLSACSEPASLSDYSNEDIVAEYEKRLDAVFKNELQNSADIAQQSTTLLVEGDTQGQVALADDLATSRQAAAESLKPFVSTNAVAQHIVGSNLIVTAASDAETCIGLKLVHSSALAGYPLASVGMAMHYLRLSDLNKLTDENYKLAYFWAKEADRRDNGPTSLTSDLFMLSDRSVIEALDEEWADWKPVNSPIRISSSSCN